MQRPRRRALWIVVVLFLFTACVVDVVTAGVGHRDLGALRLSPMLVIGTIVAVLVLAAIAGAMQTRPYGTRAADPIWWRYAGISRVRAERGTAMILVFRGTLLAGIVAIPLGVAFALAVPEQSAAIMTTAVALTGLAALARAVALRFARDGEGAPPPCVIRVQLTPLARPALNVPGGLVAARWIVAIRRGERVVPLAHFGWGLVAGVLLVRIFTNVNAQTISIAAVIGPLALVLGGARGRTTGCDDLRSPWWRMAMGNHPRAIGAWAISTALPAALALAGMAVGLGFALHAPLVGVLVMPTFALVAFVHRLLNLAVDVVFPNLLDARGPATFVRLAVQTVVIILVVTLAWGFAPEGIAVMVFSADAVLVLIVLVTLRWIASRMPA